LCHLTRHFLCRETAGASVAGNNLTIEGDDDQNESGAKSTNKFSAAAFGVEDMMDNGEETVEDFGGLMVRCYLMSYD
jgi:hypothetical protein